VVDNRLQEGKRGSFLLPRRPLLEEAVIRQGLVVFDMKITVFLLPRLTNVLSSPHHEAVFKHLFTVFFSVLCMN
jgi:hypothetical protein